MRSITRAFLRVFYILLGLPLVIFGGGIGGTFMLVGTVLFGGKENFLWHIGLIPFRAGMYLWKRAGDLMEPNPYETEALTNLTNEDLVALGALNRHLMYMYHRSDSLSGFYYKQLVLCEAECERRRISKQELANMSYEVAARWVKERKYLKPFTL